MGHEAASGGRRLSLVVMIKNDGPNLWIVESGSPVGGRGKSGVLTRRAEKKSPRVRDFFSELRRFVRGHTPGSCRKVADG